MRKIRINQDEVITLLEKKCGESGFQASFAKKHGFSPSYLSDVLRKRRDPSHKILDALGLERVVEYQIK